jgi:metal-sulfur cluster biosynthetic enzyme
LIYSIKVSEKEKKINILMTFTTPFCPMADMIQEMIKNAVKEVVPTFEITTTVTFSPAWNYDMIKDKDLKKMFE